MADSLIQLTVGVHEVPATVSERLLEAGSDAHTLDGVRRIVRELGGIVAKDVKAVARVDSVTRGAATGTVAVVKADGTAGDTLTIIVPGWPAQTFTAVATGADTSNNEYGLDEASDSAVAIELTAAINNNPTISKFITASESSATITLTAKEAGSWAHNINVYKVVTTGTALTITDFSGGDDVLAQPTMTVTFGTPDIVADDTLSIGARQYTWKASASADGEITLSTTPATAATNFAAAINADTTWTGVLTASAASAVVTLTFVGDPRVCQHIVADFVETNSGSVVLGGTVITGTAEAPTLGTTVTGSSTARTYGNRGAA